MRSSVFILLATLTIVSFSPRQDVDGVVPPFDEALSMSVWHKVKLRGISFRSIGQEPAWLPEIATGTEILLVRDYGKTRTAYPNIEPEANPEHRLTRYLTRDGDVEILIVGRDCNDATSGEQFSAAVTATLQERRLAGCGRELH